jgi:hypothetical protein
MAIQDILFGKLTAKLPHIVAMALVFVCVAARLSGRELAMGCVNNALPTEIKFHLVKSASGVTQGARFSVNVYRSSDGSYVSVRIDKFASVNIARKELANIVRASNVLAQQSKLDRTTPGAKDRVVLALRPKHGEGLTAVVWTEKETLYRIEGISIQHVLEFEKQFHS